jgi:hypothetical protein
MALPRFIEIDGRRYLWRDLVALRRAQAKPAEQQPALFAIRGRITGPPASATPRNATASRACSQCWSGAVETVASAMLNHRFAARQAKVLSVICTSGLG